MCVDQRLGVSEREARDRMGQAVKKKNTRPTHFTYCHRRWTTLASKVSVVTSD